MGEERLTGLEMALERSERQLEAERQRVDHLLTQLGWGLARIEQRLMTIEGRLGSVLTPTQWLKILGGVGLPLLVLLLTGNVDLARRLLVP